MDVGRGMSLSTSCCLLDVQPIARTDEDHHKIKSLNSAETRSSRLVQG
jgi:hypothetical protein